MELDRLDAKQRGELWVVVAKLLDEPLGVLLTDEDVDGLIASGGAHDGEDEYRASGRPAFPTPLSPRDSRSGAC